MVPRVTHSREADFTDFVATREAALRCLAILLCQDWHRADDLVQAAITKLYISLRCASHSDPALAPPPAQLTLTQPTPARLP
jgi:DNA-directed RNA polymerase specialized sigma24 family protein